MKLYELSDRLAEIQECIERLESVDIPANLHQDYEEFLQELDQTKEDFSSKVDNVLALIKSREYWIEIRKQECKRLQQLVKRDEKAIDWLKKYLKEHLEKINCKSLQTNKFSLSVKTSSQAPLVLKYEDAKRFPKKYQRVTIEVDKKLIREELKKGNESLKKYADFGEKSNYLMIK